MQFIRRYETEHAGEDEQKKKKIFKSQKDAFDLSFATLSQWRFDVVSTCRGIGRLGGGACEEVIVWSG